MIRRVLFVAVLACLTFAAARADEAGQRPPIVIDTDMGMDDAVTLALALQHPDAELAAIVACDGIASGEKAADFVERMLDLFNRRDVAVYAAPPAEPRRLFALRAFAEKVVDNALPPASQRARRPFSPEAYRVPGKKTTILALGPLTNLAAALQADPRLKADIERVIVANPPEAEQGWNGRHDPAAFAAVRASGLPLTFVVATEAALKPPAWCRTDNYVNTPTSLAERFLQRLLASPSVRSHYLHDLPTLNDELALLYCFTPEFFKPGEVDGVVVVGDAPGLANELDEVAREGRQHKHWVVFAEGPVAGELFREDVRQRKADIIAKNGRVEWFAQVLMNELHQHLGAYSIVGVKMGLRAAELLNAPQHGMRVTSHTLTTPPASCLNDGVIVATGCTPGRALFSQQPDPAAGVAVSFSYNGRRVTLKLKSEYADQIAAHLAALVDKHGLEDQKYWDAVRVFGLDIWENWHRRDLFDVSAGLEKAE